MISLPRICSFSLIFSAVSLSSLAWAQNTANSADLPPPPPLSDNASSGNATPATQNTLQGSPQESPVIKETPKGAQMTQEYQQGRGSGVHVNVDGSSYTVSPNHPAGNAVVGDGGSNTVTPAMWTLKRFGQGAAKTVESSETNDNSSSSEESLQKP